MKQLLVMMSVIKKRKGALALLACLLLLMASPPALGETLPPFPHEGPAPYAAYPATDSEGFLALEWPEAEFAHSDEEAGRWLYLSHDLRVEIERFSGTFERRKIVWFLADVRFRDEQAFRVYSANPKRPGQGQERPAKIAKTHQVVYAQNGDFFTYRANRGHLTGMIIRDGKLLHKNTYKRANAGIPPLDELALFPDGSIQMRTPGQLSAQDYLDLGVRDVLAFGPILFQDRVKDKRLDQSFTHREPRSALGVIEPGHVVGILVEGRNERSVGANLQFVADRLLERGCVEAFTLDGGQTASMVFLGQEVMDPGIYNGFQQARKQQDIVGIGQSDLVRK